MRDAQRRPRFGFWAPVYGAWGVDNDPDTPPDSSYARNRDLVRAAEAAGFDSVLIAEMMINPSIPGFDVLETWTAAAAIAEATESIEIIAAIKPLLFHPGVLAKMAVNIDHISRGRFAINLVSGWFVTEMQRLGIPMPEHDDRYRLAEEWIKAVKALWRGEAVETDGAFVQMGGLQLAPLPLRPGGPTVYLGGESEPARRLAAEEADVFFMSGRSIEQTSALVDDLRMRPREGEPLRFGISAFVIARETDEEALEEQERLRRLGEGVDRSALAAGTDPATTISKRGRDAKQVGTSGGTSAGLVGSYETVAARIQEFHDVGIELFMLQFHPFEEETTRFGREVITRVHARLEAPDRLSPRPSSSQHERRHHQ